MKGIFDIKTEQDFREKCLETFRYQYENVEVYRKFVDFLNINPDQITQISEIPFLPIEMFKNHMILDKNKEKENYFYIEEFENYGIKAVYSKKNAGNMSDYCGMEGQEEGIQEKNRNKLLEELKLKQADEGIFTLRW